MKESAPTVLHLQAHDRVLFLAIPAAGELAAVARILINGVIVALGTRDEVDRARQAMAEFENVMFIEARPDRIPWRDHYFSKIVVPPELEAFVRNTGNELHRLLAPGGEIVHATIPA